MVMWLFLIIGPLGMQLVAGHQTQEGCEAFRKAFVRDVKNVGTLECKPYQIKEERQP